MYIKCLWLYLILSLGIWLAVKEKLKRVEWHVKTDYMFETVIFPSYYKNKG